MVHKTDSKFETKGMTGKDFAKVIQDISCRAEARTSLLIHSLIMYFLLVKFASKILYEKKNLFMYGISIVSRDK